MRDIILLKLGEIVLKGLNRRAFEQKLLQNVRRRLVHVGDFEANCLQSTIYVEPKTDHEDIDAAEEALCKIFGVASVVRAAGCEKTVEAMAARAIEYMAGPMRAAKSFKVETKRADKSFPLTSIEISRYVGGELSDAFPETRVDVNDPELTVRVEVRESQAFIHGTPRPGAGGLPIGCGGTAVTLLSGGIDSPVSTYMIAKRGVHMIPVHFFSFPYTSELAKQKVLDLAGVLTEYCGRMAVEVVPFTHIQTEIREKCPEEYFTIIMRRFMMRIAQAVADRNGAKALVTGENLGQVASQTMEAIGCTEAVCRLPVFRPLIGFDKEEIVQRARKIGTFELSTLPYEDCCTVFTPRHPRTRPRLDAVEEAESPLDVDALVAEALAGIERVRVGPDADNGKEEEK